MTPRGFPSDQFQADGSILLLVHATTLQVAQCFRSQLEAPFHQLCF